MEIKIRESEIDDIEELKTVFIKTHEIYSKHKSVKKLMDRVLNVEFKQYNE